MTTLNNYIVASDEVTGFGKFGFLMQALTEEVIEELEEKDDDTLAIFLAQMGEVIAWVGHGDDSRLPDKLRPFVEAFSEADGNVPGGMGRAELLPDNEQLSV